MPKIVNISNGPRGAYLGAQLVMAEVGEVIEADDFVEEWFKPAKKGALDHDENGDNGGSKPSDPPALTGKNKAELLAIAEAEGVEIEENATNADIVSAIELAREEKANS